MEPAAGPVTTATAPAASNAIFHAAASHSLLNEITRPLSNPFSYGLTELEEVAESTNWIFLVFQQPEVSFFVAMFPGSEQHTVFKLAFDYIAHLMTSEKRIRFKAQDACPGVKRRFLECDGV